MYYIKLTSSLPEAHGEFIVAYPVETGKAPPAAPLDNPPPIC